MKKHIEAKLARIRTGVKAGSKPPIVMRYGIKPPN